MSANITTVNLNKKQNPGAKMNLGKNRIGGVFLDAQKQNAPKKAFIPFTVLCDPDYKTSLEIIKALIDGGADMLEIGFPYSDPIADGPTIQLFYTRRPATGAVDKRANSCSQSP